MSRFRQPQSPIDQLLLMPPDLREWLPANHVVHVLASVILRMDLGCILNNAGKPGIHGRPTHHPLMMLKLIIYGYMTGVVSSRKLEAATYERVDFRVLSGNEHPDHDCIAAFRARHKGAFKQIFVQALLLCDRVGLIDLQHVSVDGTKILANASRHRTHSAKQLEALRKIAQEKVDEIVSRAEQTDAAEDEADDATAKKLRGDLADPKKRVALIDEALAALKEAAKQSAAEQVAAAQQAAQGQQERREQGQKVGRPITIPDQDDLTQKMMESEKLRANLTDPDSQLMRDGATRAIVQGYNAQVVVDSKCQIIVGAGVTCEANDKRQLVPMLEAAGMLDRTLVSPADGALPRVSADTGYFSEEAVSDPRLAGVHLLVPPSRACTQGETTADAERALLEPLITGGIHWYKRAPTWAERMRARLSEPLNRDHYHQRNAIVEPVFGQTKENRGLRRFRLRGLPGATAEWYLMCAGHNLLKLIRYGQPVAA